MVTPNGTFHPFALVAGRAIARWRLARGEVVLEPLEPVRERVAKALEVEAADVVRYLA